MSNYYLTIKGYKMIAESCGLDLKALTCSDDGETATARICNKDGSTIIEKRIHAIEIPDLKIRHGRAKKEALKEWLWIYHPEILQGFEDEGIS